MKNDIGNNGKQRVIKSLVMMRPCPIVMGSDVSVLFKIVDAKSRKRLSLIQGLFEI